MVTCPGAIEAILVDNLTTTKRGDRCLTFLLGILYDVYNPRKDIVIRRPSIRNCQSGCSSIDTNTTEVDQMAPQPYLTKLRIT